MINGVLPGTIGTVAGTSEFGFSGDGADARQACLNEPKDVAVDTQGNVYIADSENHVIRKVDGQTGCITTVAGSVQVENAKPMSPHRIGESQDRNVLSDDPLAEPEDAQIPAFAHAPDVSGMVRYVVGQASGAGRFGGDGGAATQALLNFPSSITISLTGALYIADTFNHRIRRVDPKTGIISTIAGTGQGKFSGDGGPASSACLKEPVALVEDREGNLYIADQSNNRVRKIDAGSGIISTVAGNGDPGYTGDGMAAIESGVSGPSGLALDAEDNLYIADTFSGRIRRIDKHTGIIETVVGDGGEFRYQRGENESSKSLSRPYGIAFDHDDRLFITDSDNHLIRKWNRKTDAISVVAGNGTAQFEGDGQAPEKSALNFPFGVAVDQKGQVFIADTFNHRIRMVAV